MSSREFCLTCRRAVRVCQCADIRRFESAPVFVILTHPTERRMKTGTGRMAHLCLSNSILIEGVDFKDNEQVNALLNEPKYFPVLLSPGKEAMDLKSFEPPRERRLLIFVIDSKWSLVKTVLNRSPNLKALPQICFTPTKPSTIEIREQPNPVCLSTIEAVHFVLETFSPGAPEHSHLLYAFNKMVQRQLDFESTPNRRHRGRKR